MAPSVYDALPDVDRHEMEALHHLEALRCPCGCGNYVDESMSRDWNWDVQSTKCYAGQALDIERRRHAEENKDIKGASDGLLWHASPVPPIK